MKKILGIIFVCLFISLPTVAEQVERIVVVGNQRMDSESVRILSDVKIGENIGLTKTNNIAKKLQASGYFSKIKVGVKTLEDAIV